MVESDVPALPHSWSTILIQGEDVGHTREEISDGGATEGTRKLEDHSYVLNEDGEAENS